MSEGKHIKFTLVKDNVVFDAVGFGKGNLYTSFTENDIVDVAGIIQINSWNNTQKLQILIDDIKLSESARIALNVPDRNDMAAVYRYLRRTAVSNMLSDNPEMLSRKISYAFGTDIGIRKLNNCIEIFNEMKLITYVRHDDKIDIYVFETTGKIDLEKSKILNEIRKKEGMAL